MNPLSADRPRQDPKDDLFGHAAFAKSLADSIQTARCGDGLVLALYGPWGSGKSTVLAYVLHYLDQRPKEEQAVIVTFNPWWFSGQEHLARAFFGQLQAVLPEKSEELKQLGQLLGDFTEGIGGLIDLTGITGGAGTVIGKILGSMSKAKPKDVPELKAKISNLLREAGKRILVVVDDIDRLTPAETRQLFTVIKALADFPNVTYLLAFDREVAARAIGKQMGMPGDRYLEKIIQVPFEIPIVDRVAMQAALFRNLDEIMKDTPAGLFDSSYWTNVYNDGLDTLFNVPRDVVRFVNTLSVTYPALRGEVNPVDFIALEALRVFVPSVYNNIRMNSELLAGHRSTNKKAETLPDGWLKEVPERFRATAEELLTRLFPKLESTTYGANWLSTWRRTLRACHPDLFQTYFRFSVPSDVIRRSEIQEILQLPNSAGGLQKTFIDAAQQRRPDGLSKARALLERLTDHVETDIQIEHVPVFISVLLDIGDRLLIETDRGAMFDFGNQLRVFRIVYHLLKRVPTVDRVPLLKKAIEEGEGLYVQSYLLHAIEELVSEKPAESLVDSVDLEVLKKAWIDKVRSHKSQLLLNPQLHSLLLMWQKWGDEEEIRAWCQEATRSDEGVLAFISGFAQFISSNRAGDWAVSRRLRLNPKWIEDFLDSQTIAERLKVLQESKQLPVPVAEIVGQFLKEAQMIKEGKNPDSPFAFMENS